MNAIVVIFLNQLYQPKSTTKGTDTKPSSPISKTTVLNFFGVTEPIEYLMEAIIALSRICIYT